MSLKKALALVSVILVGFFSKGSLSASFEGGFDNFSNSSSSNVEKFLRRSGGTPSSYTGPSSGANSTTYYLYFETSNGYAYNTKDIAILTSPTVNSRYVSFYYHMYGSDVGTLSVEKKVGSSWVELWSITGQQQTSHNDEWTKKTLALSDVSESHQIRFIAEASGGWKGDIALDEVTFEDLNEAAYFYKYDALGRLEIVENKTEVLKTYIYDPAGNRKEVVNGEFSAPENSPPEAKNDSVFIQAPGSSSTVYVLNNDTDAEGDSLEITAINNSDSRFYVTQNANGSLKVTVTNGGTFIQSGFSYTISDGNGGSDTATVTVSYEGSSFNF